MCPALGGAGVEGLAPGIRKTSAHKPPTFRHDYPKIWLVAARVGTAAPDGTVAPKIVCHPLVEWQAGEVR
jgi:hypothetical protein